MSHLLLILLLLSGGFAMTAQESPVPVRITAGPNGAFSLTRGGKPYVVKGICGTHDLALASALGANSLRTYGHQDAETVLRNAHAVGMTVTVGFWLPHDAGLYRDAGFQQRWRADVRATAERLRHHPALLFWALGNEVNSGADNEDTWRFIDELAGIVREVDPIHPVMTVLAGAPTGTIERIARVAPRIDLLGINLYGGLPGAPGALARVPTYTKPYLITEWGPQGHWEAPRTPWGRPVEADSASKAETYTRGAQLIASFAPRCFGSYVFLWGQKQERTPTWYSMFVESRSELGLNREACPTVDAMGMAWGGRTPPNRAPQFQHARIDGASAPAWITVRPQQRILVELAAIDPDGDALRTQWEVLREPTQLGNGGSHENRPPTIADALTPLPPMAASLALAEPGEYRLFAYVLDGRGRVATWNLPIQVAGDPVPESAPPAPVAERERRASTPRPAPSAPASAASVSLADPALAERYDTLLRERVRLAIAAGRAPDLRLAMGRERVAARIESISVDGALRLRVGTGPSSGLLDGTWQRLSAAERCDLAQALHDGLNADDLAFLAHFLFDAGRTSEGRTTLARAGAAGADVRAAWGIAP